LQIHQLTNSQKKCLNLVLIKSHYLNIVSFDVPYPADYGGVIDVFYKLQALKKAGVKIILHSFEYGRKPSRELNRYCEKVYYYKRKKSFIQLFSDLPFIVKSRISQDLKKNLLGNDYPILFEGLHTCFLLSDPDLRNRKKIFRESNIEHEYYRHLAAAEKSALKKKFFISEARKLEKFEGVLGSSDLMLIVSETETEYFKKKYPKNRVEYLPSFHGNSAITSKKGKGTYILYHGKLSVPENESAAAYLVMNVFSKISRPVIIAGMDPSPYLEKMCGEFKNISLVKNPGDKKMTELTENAHIHCMYTAQPTGLKLKLLNVLYQGRFVMVNKHMIAGTSLRDACIACEQPAQWIREIENYFGRTFSETEIRERKVALRTFDNAEKTKRLLKLLGMS
jgi:hypothetical protein